MHVHICELSTGSVKVQENDKIKVPEKKINHCELTYFNYCAEFSRCEGGGTNYLRFYRKLHKNEEFLGKRVMRAFHAPLPFDQPLFRISTQHDL